MATAWPKSARCFCEGLNQPFGMALLGDTFYVGNTDGVVAFPYTPGATRITAPGRKLATFKPGGHWTRSLLPSPRRPEAVRRRRLADQYRRRGHGRRAGPRRHPRTRCRKRHEPHLRLRPAQCGRHGLGTADRRALDGGKRARRAGRRDASRLSDLGARRRLLRLALLLLGPDGGRPGAAGSGAVAKAITPDYALGGHTASLGLCWLPAGTLPGFPDGMVDRAARLLEPQQTQRLQGRVHAVRERPPGRAAARYSDRVSRGGRANVLWPAGRRDDRTRWLRCW